jgi:hypothetical protein
MKPPDSQLQTPEDRSGRNLQFPSQPFFHLPFLPIRSEEVESDEGSQSLHQHCDTGLPCSPVRELIKVFLWFLSQGTCAGSGYCFLVKVMQVPILEVRMHKQVHTGTDRPE